MNETMKIILADDNIDFCEKLQRQLNNYTGVNVVGKAKDGAELLDLISEWQPDVVVTDAMLPQMGGLSVIRATRELSLKKMPI